MLTRLSSDEDIQEWHDRLVDPARPVLVGYGPVEASTTMALEAWPSIVWDTNLFYRDLGVHFRASRAAIRRAYQDLGGEANVRLTMIAGVLLNPEHRLAYDRVPLGRLYFDDEIEEALRIAAATAAGETRAEGGEVDSELLNDMLDAMREAPDYMDDSPAYVNRYPWSYYLFRMPIPTERTPDETERLDLWRAALISALWQIFPLDRPPTLAVGYFRSEPGEDDIRVAKVGFRVVCFMSDTLSFDLAEVLIAARLIVQVTNNTHTNTQGAIPWQAEASRQQSSPQQASLAPPSSV
jgi:hypothetical protein